MTPEELEKKVPGSKLFLWGASFMLLGSILWSILMFAILGFVLYFIFK